MTADFYPRPPRGGRPTLSLSGKAADAISIHALREEGDKCNITFTRDFYISIHALREEGDFAAIAYSFPPPVFLSTPSARRATSCGFSFLK